MKEWILHKLPRRVYPLVLVSDPDHLFQKLALLPDLVVRGYRVITDTDPISRRLLVERERPWSVERPLLILTEGPLDLLPFDLWQSGHHVEISVDLLFPNLFSSVVRSLTPKQQQVVFEAPAPTRKLGENATYNFVLERVFGVTSKSLKEPEVLIDLLTRVHESDDRAPQFMRRHVARSVVDEPPYRDWPMLQLVSDPQTFFQFVHDQWRLFVEIETHRTRGGVSPSTSLFHHLSRDNEKENFLSRLLDSEAVKPIEVGDSTLLPAWARRGVVTLSEIDPDRASADSFQLIREIVGKSPTESSWRDWCEVAKGWARLTAASNTEAERDRIFAVSEQMDDSFSEWLRHSYRRLGADKIPVPHHVHHLPEAMARTLRMRSAERVVLLVLDGMSLGDWITISEQWRIRHANWNLSEQLVLAQIPTITSVSRQALISGLSPQSFPESLLTTAREVQRWTEFWKKQGIPPDSTWFHKRGVSGSAFPLPPLHSQVVCYVDHSIDMLIHGATLGSEQLASSLRIWLERVSPKVETLIEELLNLGFAVFVSSDHGHVEATGIGQPLEGIAAFSRGKRFRMYQDPLLVRRAKGANPHTQLWGEDALLPRGYWALMPVGRRAFAPPGATIVTHGGLTVEEVIVPYIRISED